MPLPRAGRARAGHPLGAALLNNARRLLPSGRPPAAARGAPALRATPLPAAGTAPGPAVSEGGIRLCPLR